MLQNLCAPNCRICLHGLGPSGGRKPTTTSSNRNGTTSCSLFCYWRTTSSVSAMINTLQWQTLEQRRLQSRLIFLHKYCYKAIDIKEPIAIRARNLNTNYQAIHSRLRCYENSFALATVRDWNALHPDIRNEAEITKFKVKLMQLAN